MLCLSLTQPWASLMALGVKEVETRGWQPSRKTLPTLPAQIAIHAAITFPKEARDLCSQWPFNLYTPDWKALPTGALLAVGTLCEIYPTENAVIWIPRLRSAEERAFGDYSRGRFAWWFTEMLALPEPIEIKGALSLWQCEHPALTDCANRRRG